MKLSVLAAPLLASAAVLANAQSEPSDLDQVIVTAARIPQPLDSAIASVTVITRADIERFQPHSVAELLTGLVGISVSTNGDLGKVTSVFVRGTNADHVLVLIDGIKLGAATTGAAAWEQLPVEQIDRIEIVRGPSSSLYGSEALGGVVQIFTRRGAPSAAGVPSLALSGGSHGTYQGAAAYSGSAREGWYDASVSGLYTEGIPICAASAPATASCYTTTPQQGYWSGAAAASAGYRWERATATLDLIRVEGDTRYDGSVFSGDESRVVQQALGGSVTLMPHASLSTAVAAGESLDRSRQYFGRTPEGFFNTRRQTASWLNRWSLAAAQLLFGADLERDVIASDTDFPVRSRTDTGVVGLYQWLSTHEQLQLSGRHDHNQQFGNHFTGALEWAHRFDDALRVTASYGAAFKAPTFNELYYPFFGDPLLRPETSHSAEIGLNGRRGALSWAVSTYQTRIDDLIEYNPQTGAASNIGRARIRGLETQLLAQARRWRVQVQLTALDPRDTGVNDGALLPERAQYTARLDLDRDIGHFSLGGTLFGSGPRFDDPANTERLGGYGTLDLRASWRLESRWQAQALLKNVLDRSYQTARYYNQPGRSAYLTLRYQPSKS